VAQSAVVNRITLEGILMPSFDIISEVNLHELTNAVDQANRELENRFDFKGQNAKYELDKNIVTQHAPSDFQLQQMLDILKARLIARKIDVRTMDVADAEIALGAAKQKITIKQGIERDFAKKIINLLKEAKLKVDTQIQGEKLRVLGKKKDDLQLAMAVLRGKELELPLQFENFRD
jgi:cyclic-di-GMP-binding protein